MYQTEKMIALATALYNIFDESGIFALICINKV